MIFKIGYTDFDKMWRPITYTLEENYSLGNGEKRKWTFYYP